MGTTCLPCSVLIHFHLKCLYEHEKLLLFFLSSARREKKNLAKLDWGKHREGNYRNKSHRDQFLRRSGKTRETAETETQHNLPKFPARMSCNWRNTNTGKGLLKSHHASLLVTPPICQCPWLQKFPACTGSAGLVCGHGGWDDSVLQKSYRKLGAGELTSYCPTRPPESLESMRLSGA